MRRLNNCSIDLTFFYVDAQYVEITSCHVVQEESPELGLSPSGGLKAFSHTYSYMWLP